MSPPHGCGQSACCVSCALTFTTACLRYRSCMESGPRTRTHSETPSVSDKTRSTVAALIRMARGIRTTTPDTPLCHRCDPARGHDAVVPSFDVPDRAAALAALLAAECTLVPIGPHAPGEHYVRDPHGVVFDVIERSENGAP